MNIHLLYSLLSLDNSLAKRGKSIFPLLENLESELDSYELSCYIHLFLATIHLKKQNAENHEIINFAFSYSQKTKTSALENYLLMMYILNALHYIKDSFSYSLLVQDDFSMFSSLEIDKFYRLLQLDFLSFTKEEMQNSSHLEQTFWILLKSRNYFEATLLAHEFDQEVEDLVYLLAPISYNKLIPMDAILEFSNHQQMIEAIFKFQLNYGV